MNFRSKDTIRQVCIFFRVNLEAMIWLAALIALFFHDPHTVHYSLCPLSNLGFDFCPGCGLGHAVSLLFRGEFLESFRAHPLGIPAVILLVYRIISLIYKNHYHHKIIFKS